MQWTTSSKSDSNYTSLPPPHYHRIFFRQLYNIESKRNIQKLTKNNKFLLVHFKIFETESSNHSRNFILANNLYTFQLPDKHEPLPLRKKIELNISHMSGIEIFKTRNIEPIKNSTIKEKAINLWNVRQIVIDNINAENILIFNRIVSDILVLMMGKASDNLLKVALEYFHKSCRLQSYTKRCVKQMEKVRMYVFLFQEFFNNLVKTINQKWNINMSQNIYVLNMNQNLKTMMKHIAIITEYEANSEKMFKHIELNLIPYFTNEYGSNEYHQDIIISEKEWLLQPVATVRNVIKLLKYPIKIEVVVNKNIV